jgi:hypothetical protein
MTGWWREDHDRVCKIPILHLCQTVVGPVPVPAEDACALAQSGIETDVELKAVFRQRMIDS